MKKKIAVSCFITASAMLVAAGFTFAGKPVPPTAVKVWADGRYGEYCTDPQSWKDAGYNVGIWGPSVPFKAQATDKSGYLLDGTFNFNVILTGQTGTMAVQDAANKEYQFSPSVPQGIHYDVDVAVDSAAARLTIYRDPAKCDACHATPPGHIADPATWGKCHECHNLGVVMHKHAYSKGGITTACYTCHPTGCLDTDLHKTRLNMWCTDCHGDLTMTQNNTFKISGMAGKPYCADCHDANHAEYQPRSGARELFVESNGHGRAKGARMACISCHGAPHRVQKPNFDVGLGNNCSGCHTDKATDNNMGPNCGSCHVSSFDPHLTRK